MFQTDLASIRVQTYRHSFRHRANPSYAVVQQDEMKEAAGRYGCRPRSTTTAGDRVVSARVELTSPMDKR